MTESRILPFQYEDIPSDLLFLAGATRTIRPNTPAAGPGDSIRLSGAPAATGSNANGGDTLLGGALGDGTGKKGRVHVESTTIILDSIDITTIAPDGPTQVNLAAAPDGPHTELLISTPQGNIQATKNGLLNFDATLTAAVVASVAVEDFTSDPPNPSPTQQTVGAFKVLQFPSGSGTQARGEAGIPGDYRGASADNVLVFFKYTVDAGANTTVRIQLSGGADNFVIPPTVFNLNVSAVVAGQLTTSPVVLTIPAASLAPLSEIGLLIQRLTFAGEFTGNFQLASMIFQYKSKANVAVQSVSTDLFVGTAQPSPTPGTLGVFRTMDFPFGSVAETECFFNVPKNYNPGTDAWLKLVYAMDSSQPGARVDLRFQGSVNNVTALPPQTVSVFPTPTTNLIQNTFPLYFLPNTLTNFDEVAFDIRRLATDTYNGNFKLITAHLIFGALALTSGVNLEVDYNYSDIIAGAGPPDTDTLADADNEVYRTAAGNAPNEDVTFVARCRLPTNLHEINWVRFVSKVSNIVGNGGVIFTIVKADGTIVYTSAKQVFAARTELFVPGGLLTAQPAPGERFFLKAQAFVDNGETTYVAAAATVGFD